MTGAKHNSVVRRTNGSVAYYTFTDLQPHDGLRHAVFTRHGGVSPPPWATLNVSRSVGDMAEAVEENHRRICRVLGVAREDIVTTYQVGGNHVALVQAGDRGTVVPDTDALITDSPGVPLMLRFADCLPVLLYDPRRHVVGLAHAGWRGTLARVAQRTASEMVRRFGSHPADLIVGIGPGIGPCCYQVGPDVVAATRAAFTDADRAEEPLLIRAPDGSWHLDLWAANVRQLREVGVERIAVSGLCTACRKDEFYSHRGERGRTGRFAAMVVLQ